MGTVWLAEDTELKRRVALKVLAAETNQDRLSESLANEARVLARLEHPGIVPVHDIGRLPDGRIFYAMKFVEGQRLDHLASGTSRFERLRIFRKICDAVAFAHSRGVIHRDLKPENIMLGAFGEVLVMDWGVAVLRGEQANTGVVAGTPGYMAPEQERGETDERSDVYSLGAVLACLLREERVPRHLAAIAAKAQSADPVQRYASVEQLAYDIDRFLEGEPVSAYRDNLWDILARHYRRHQVLILLLLTYVVVRFLIFFFTPR